MQGEPTPLSGASVTTGMLESKIEEISIACAQRDVHLSTAQPLDVRVHHTSSGVADFARETGKE